MKAPALIGRRSGLLTVLGEAGRDAVGRLRLSVLCDCGHGLIVRADNFRRGNSRSCGCITPRRRG